MALSFTDYFLTEKKAATANNKNDSMGKIHEILVGRALSGGQWPAHYRDAANSPDKIHDMHARALFGDKFKFHPEYKRMVADAGVAAKDIQKQVGGKITRAAWTSQAGDHEKETGVKDPNSKADLIVTTGSGKKAMKHSISLKIGKTKTPNYTNPGIDTFQKWSGTELHKHTADHRALLAKYGNPNHDAYKAYRDGTDAKGKKIADAIKASSGQMNKNIAAVMRKGMSARNHKELAGIIMQSTNPKTHLPTLISHTLHNKDGSSTHHMHTQEDHIKGYLKEFDNLHVKPAGNGISVVIHGTHRKTGKIMPVWQTQVYAGGRPANNVPRGATTLPSEAKIAAMNSGPAPKQAKAKAGQQKLVPVKAAPKKAAAPQKIKVKSPKGRALPMGGSPTYSYSHGGFH